MLCGKCQDIHFKLPRGCEQMQQDPARLSNISIDSEDVVLYFHHESKADLRASANRGCHFCAMLWTYMTVPNYKYVHMEREELTNGELVFRREVIDSWVTRDFGEWNRQDWIYISCGKRKVTTTSRPDTHFNGQLIEHHRASTVY